MVKVRIEPIESWVKIVVDGDLSPKARSQAVADFAREAIAETEQANRAVLGRETPATVYVDGRAGAPLETVDPDRGRIVAEFDLVMQVLDWIWNRLRESSPVRSGAYREAHRLFADGAEVAATGDVPEAEEYAFTNTVPYARKIEIGKTQAGRDFVIQVEPRIYDRVAKEARSRFGNLAQIGYTFRGIVGGMQVDPIKAGASTLKRGRNGRFVAQGGPREHNKPKLRYPTITVRLR